MGIPRTDNSDTTSVTTQLMGLDSTRLGRPNQIIEPDSDVKLLFIYKNFGRFSSVLLTSHLKQKSTTNQQTEYKNEYINMQAGKVTAALEQAEALLRHLLAVREKLAQDLRAAKRTK